MNKLCILCLKPLSGTESPEHVLLNAFGGRVTTRDAICTACNHRTNEIADSAFAKDFAFWRNYLWLNAGDGDPPPTIRGLSTPDGQRYDLAPGGRPVSRDLQFEPDPVNPRSATVKGSAEKIARQIPNFAKKLGVSEESFAAGIHGGFTERATSPGRTERRSVLCAPYHLRSITKSALILWSLTHGSEEVYHNFFDQARAFALGGPAEHPFEGVSDCRPAPVEPPRHLGLGVFDNWISVWCGSDGYVYGHMRLLGHFGYSLRLGQCQRDLPATILWTNPVTSQFWRGIATPPTSWCFPAEIDSAIERNAIMHFGRQAELRHSELSLEALVDRTMAIHLSPGERVTQEQIAAVMQEIELTIGHIASSNGETSHLELPRTREQTLRQLGIVEEPTDDPKPE